jgi:hypothetical protein
VMLDPCGFHHILMDAMCGNVLSIIVYSKKRLRGQRATT